MVGFRGLPVAFEDDVAFWVFAVLGGEATGVKVFFDLVDHLGVATDVDTAVCGVEIKACEVAELVSGHDGLDAATVAFPVGVFRVTGDGGDVDEGVIFGSELFEFLVVAEVLGIAAALDEYELVPLASLLVGLVHGVERSEACAGCDHDKVFVLSAIGESEVACVFFAHEESVTFLKFPELRGELSFFDEDDVELKIVTFGRCTTD